MSSSSSPSLATNVTSDSVYMCSTPMSSSAPAPRLCSPASKKVLNLPPGYHFLPTDAELVVHYLRPRLANANHRLPLPIFINERILNYHPDKLIEKYRSYGEDRWFFFTCRERKHSSGNRPNRTTPDNGHWNATGSIRLVRSAGGVLVGCRRTLVFYEASRSRKKKNQPGLPPMVMEEEEDGDGGQAAKAKDDGVKTEWTMYEYESVNSEAEFQAIRGGGGDANKMDKLVLCTIQKKKHSQEGGEGKKSTKRKTKEEGLELSAEGVPAAGGGGDVEQGSRAGTTEVQDEDHVQRALMEAAAAEPQVELAYHAPAAGVDNFSVDPNQNMPYYYLTNSLAPVPIPPQETLMMAPASGDNQIVMHQQNYYFINSSMNMKNSQSFHVQETPPQEFLPYLDTKMATSRGGRNTMDHMLQNRFVNMMPSQAPSMSGIGTYVSPRRSKSNVWEHSAELHGDKSNRPLKSEDDWWISDHQEKLLGRELDNPYVTNSLSFVPAPQQEMMMELVAARGNNHTVMHQRNYLNHSSNMWNSQFHVQATLPQQEFLPCSSTNKAAPLGGGSIMDHHMLQNRIVNVMPAAEAHNFTGFFPSLSSSNYGHLSTRMDHPGPSSVSFPSQQSHGAGSRIGMQGPLLNNRVNLNHQNSSAAAAASMVGYDQRNGVGLAPKIV